MLLPLPPGVLPMFLDCRARRSMFPHAAPIRQACGSRGRRERRGGRGISWGEKADKMMPMYDAGCQCYAKLLLRLCFVFCRPSSFPRSCSSGFCYFLFRQCEGVFECFESFPSFFKDAFGCLVKKHDQCVAVWNPNVRFQPMHACPNIRIRMGSCLLPGYHNGFL